MLILPGQNQRAFQSWGEGNELTVSYTRRKGFPRPDWVLREYSRGGFVRTFTLDTSIGWERIRCQIHGRGSGSVVTAAGGRTTFEPGD